MFDPGAFGVFLAAVVVLVVIPGPAVLYIVTRSISQGRAAGVASCLGVALGGAVHVVGAALGLSAMLASSALAFSAVKYAGAAYLVWLGLQKLASRADLRLPEAGRRQSLRRIFWEGVLVNILNPKTALFFLAFLPQFVDPARGSSTLQLIALGAVFLGVALVSDTAWSLLAGRAALWLKSRPGFVRSERYLSGSVYIGLGLATALAGHGRK